MLCIMPAGRAKYNFYAVTNGRETGVYTNWPHAGDSVLGFAKAKYKGFETYTCAADAMVIAGFSDFTVFDGQNTYNRCEYEQSRLKQVRNSELNSLPHSTDTSVGEGILQIFNTGEISQSSENQQMTRHNTEHTVYIDGSCVRNGTTSATAGIGLFWGDKHPLNCSDSLTADATLTNNKAELRAAIKAIQLAGENNMQELIINSDSKYVINGITEWTQKWMENGWKTTSGEHVKNKETWMELMNMIKSTNINITWQHVLAHSGNAGNEEADKLALRAAKRNAKDIQVQAPKEEKSTITD